MTEMEVLGLDLRTSQNRIGELEAQVKQLTIFATSQGVGAVEDKHFRVGDETRKLNSHRNSY